MIEMSASASEPLPVKYESVQTQLSHQETRIHNAGRQGPKPPGIRDAKRRF